MSLGQENEEQENMIYFAGKIKLRDLKFQQSEKGMSMENGQKASWKEIIVLKEIRS